MRTLARHAEFLRDVSDRPTIADHPGHKQATAIKIQTGISVGHEDLLVVQT